MSCSSCSSEVPEGSRFCPACGLSCSPASPSSDVPTRLAGGEPASPSSSRGVSAHSSHPQDQARFIPGARVADRYRVIGLLGRGGMGEVYRADDMKLGQAVALKFLPESLASNQDRLDRFYQEVRISRQVTHSNVCRVFDIDEFEGQPFLSMEYIDGEDLSSLLKRIGRLPKEKAIQIARQVCAGLAAAHDKGILHRDLKPANVLIDGRGHAHITDFGLAGVAHELVGNEVRAGTPAYMAPEQLSGKEVTLKSDIYSLGLTLYELFTGKPAFEAATTGELMKLQTESTPTSPTAFIEGFDPAVEAIILRCLDKTPALRPESALAVSAALPGGDPLAAALAAGETPSPEMVADAGEDRGLKPTVALALMITVLAGLVLQVLFGEGNHSVHRMEMPNSPEVLRAEARDLISSFGYERGGGDSAHGFQTSSDAVREIQENETGAHRWDRLGTIRPAAFQYWYRESPRPLVPANSIGTLSSGDPPISLSGMINLGLDPLGQLIYFKAVPPEVEEEGVERSAPPDWSLVFASAGLELAEFTETPPTWNPDINCGSRAAWTGAFPDQPGAEIRIEACGYDGKLAYFRMIAPWTRPGRTVRTPESGLLQALGYGLLAVMLLILLGAAFLAWRSLRMGRGDRKGGFRLAVYLYLMMLAADLLRLHHVASLAEVALLFNALSVNLLITALVWMLYQGLEPYVRRIWPEVLITWSRVLSGRLRDPRVGRDILMGGVVFAASLVLSQVTQTLLAGLGFPEPQILQTSQWPLLGAAGILSTVVLGLINPLIGPLLLTFTLLLLRVLLKKQWLAVSVMGVLFTLLISVATATQMPEGAESVGLLIAIVTASALLNLSLVYFVLTRYGYLAFVFTSFFSNPGGIFPITSDLSAWYAGPALISLLLPMALALYGFHLARAGRPVFGDSLLED